MRDVEQLKTGFVQNVLFVLVSFGLTVGYYFDFEIFLTQVAKNGSMQSKSKTFIDFLFFVLFLGTSARSIGAQTVVKVPLYRMSTSTSTCEY